MKNKEATAARVEEGRRMVVTKTIEGREVRQWSRTGHWKDCGFYSEGDKEPVVLKEEEHDLPLVLIRLLD